MWGRISLAVVMSGALSWTATAQAPPSVTLKLPPPAAEPAVASASPSETAPEPTTSSPEPSTPQALVLPPDETVGLPPPVPQPKPKPAKQKPPKAKLQPGEMTPIDDIPGGKLYVAAPGKAPVFRCFVRDVMAFYDRTHIRCYNKARGKLNFFAVDTNQPVAATLLEKGLAAMQSGKPVTITFAPGSDLNPSNCARANCRRLIDIRE
jgi:hypothetical protein